MPVCEVQACDGDIAYSIFARSRTGKAAVRGDTLCIESRKESLNRTSCKVTQVPQLMHMCAQLSVHISWENLVVPNSDKITALLVLKFIASAVFTC